MSGNLYSIKCLEVVGWLVPSSTNPSIACHEKTTNRLPSSHVESICRISPLPAYHYQRPTVPEQHPRLLCPCVRRRSYCDLSRLASRLRSLSYYSRSSDSGEASLLAEAMAFTTCTRALSVNILAGVCVPATRRRTRRPLRSRTRLPSNSSPPLTLQRQGHRSPPDQVKPPMSCNSPWQRTRRPTHMPPWSRTRLRCRLDASWFFVLYRILVFFYLLQDSCWRRLNLH
jgi:hypothetical protein